MITRLRSCLTTLLDWPISDNSDLTMANRHRARRDHLDVWTFLGLKGPWWV